MGMQGDSVVAYTELVGKVHGVRHTSQCGCSCCIACSCLLDLYQAAVSRADTCQVQAQEVAPKVILVVARVQRDWCHHKMQGQVWEGASLNRQGPLVKHSKGVCFPVCHDPQGSCQ